MRLIDFGVLKDVPPLSSMIALVIVVAVIMTGVVWLIQEGKL